MKRYKLYVPCANEFIKVKDSTKPGKTTFYTADEGPKDFMTPVQYTEWVSVRTALNVITTELIEVRRSEGKYHSPFVNFQIFVLRIPYGLEQDVARIINEKALPQLPQLFRTEQLPDGFMLAYAPMHIRQREKGEDKKATRQLASLIPNTLFLFAEEQTAKELISIGLAKKKQRGQKEDISLIRMRFMYDHTQQLSDGTNPVLTMHPRAMFNFMTMADTMNPFVKIIRPEDTTDKYRCRVIDGAFKGIEGYFSRYEGNFVVLVDIAPFGYLKSCYVPRAQVELLEEFSINDKLIRMTLDTVTHIAQHPKDPRMWFVLKCNKGFEIDVAEYINLRQRKAITDYEAHKVASPIFYNEAVDFGVLPVIAYCPVYGASCNIETLVGRPLYEGHFFLYATKEDALRVANSSFRLDDAPDVPFVHFCFEQDSSQSEIFTPLIIPYGTIIHLVHIVNTAKGEILINKELAYVSPSNKRKLSKLHKM